MTEQIRRKLQDEINALEHELVHELPKEIKKQVADEIKSSKNAIEVWELADAGWRVYIRNRMAAFKQARDRSFNTPRAVNTAEFMRRTVGIEDIKTAWSFDGKDSIRRGAECRLGFDSARRPPC